MTYHNRKKILPHILDTAPDQLSHKKNLSSFTPQILTNRIVINHSSLNSKRLKIPETSKNNFKCTEKTESTKDPGSCEQSTPENNLRHRYKKDFEVMNVMGFLSSSSKPLLKFQQTTQNAKNPTIGIADFWSKKNKIKYLKDKGYWNSYKKILYEKDMLEYTDKKPCKNYDLAYKMDFETSRHVLNKKDIQKSRIWKKPDLKHERNMKSLVISIENQKLRTLDTILTKCDDLTNSTDNIKRSAKAFQIKLSNSITNNKLVMRKISKYDLKSIQNSATNLSTY
jgi:hypothetical protein